MLNIYAIKQLYIKSEILISQRKSHFIYSMLSTYWNSTNNTAHKFHLCYNITS